MVFDAKVMLIVSGLMFGGGQRIVMELVEEAAREGVKLSVVLLGKNEKEFDWPDAESIEYDGRYNRVRTLVGTAWQLHRVIKQEQPRIIHTHGWDADVIGYLACLGLKVKQLVHLHVTPDWLISTKPKQAVRRILTRRVLSSTKVQAIAVSNAVQEHWTRYFKVTGQGMIVIHNGVNLSRYQPRVSSEVNNDLPVIGVAARLAPMKGIEYLIQALKILKGMDVPFRLEVAGVGELRESLEESAVRSGIGSEVHFLGKVDDMRVFYDRIDVLALPSISTEGLPLTALEAMASGVPVVGTRLAGIPEAVRDGVDGYLVSPKNVPDLADRLRTLLSDPILRRRFGDSARRRAVESFSQERFAREVFALYR